MMIILGAIAITVITVFIAFSIARKKEKYTLMKDLGKFPLDINRLNEAQPSETQSLKYSGHRYDRHHYRGNPHSRSYIFN